MKAYRQGGFAQYEEGVGTLRASGGDYGGGTETLVIDEMVAIPIHDKATRWNGGGPTRNGDGAGNGLGVGNIGDPCPTLSCGDHHMVMCLNDQGGSVMSVTEDVSGCLRAQEHGHQPIVAGFSAGQGEKAGGIGWQEECSPSLKAANSGTNMVPVVLPFDTTQITSPQNGNKPNYGDPCHPLAAGAHAPAIVMAMQAFGGYKESEIASGCKARDYKDGTDLVVSVDCRNGYENEELSGTIQAKENGGQSLNYINPVRCDNTVRRLTPLECERLQGYPDGWTDIGEWVDSKGKKHKVADSPRYKALGNSIALPFWKYLLKRISAQYERDATLGSLFDGIGGFPLCWEQINGQGSARWASEIEEFPIAVTTLRFPERKE